MDKPPHLKERSPPYFLHQFLKAHYQGGELLLALSGGADSLSLFHSLILLKKPFAIAHVNHRFRQESDEEERKMIEMANHLSIPCFVKRLSLEGEQNIENRARNERYTFFQEIARERSTEALLLGHHADDQAETLIKRLFEGAYFAKWKGIEAISTHASLPLWRPLLKIRKKEIYHWLHEIGVTPFEDRTNHSTDNLRGKCRTTLFPLLSEHFGKEIVPPLLKHREDLLEITSLLEELAEPFNIETPSFEIPPLHPTLQKYLIRKWLDFHDLSLDAASLNRLIASIPLKGGRSFSSKKNMIHLLDDKIYF